MPCMIAVTWLCVAIFLNHHITFVLELARSSVAACSFIELPAERDIVRRLPRGLDLRCNFIIDLIALAIPATLPPTFLCGLATTLR